MTLKQLKMKEDGQCKKAVNVTVPILKEWVIASYEKLRRGGQASGVDGESWEEFDKNLERNLHVLWSRLASGSYHPQAVKAVEIPKLDGTKRKLGIPTVRDRICQGVIAMLLEARIDRIFHPNSYGYRPMKSAHQAVAKVKENNKRYAWVIDMDISKFFDEIDHVTLRKGLKRLIPEPWIHIYIDRWLEAPIQEENGELIFKNGKGTPQGGVISPLLANIYLHFTLDLWLNKVAPQTSFVRYADDVVIHCNSKTEAEALLELIKERLSQVKLSIKPSKTKIAFCKDYRRAGEHEHMSFNFLGFEFKPTRYKGQRGNVITAFCSDICPEKEKKITSYIRSMQILKNTSLSIEELGSHLRDTTRGWINYYEKYGRTGLTRIFSRLNRRIVHWLRKKYKVGFWAGVSMYNELIKMKPGLFVHWKASYCFR